MAKTDTSLQPVESRKQVLARVSDHHRYYRSQASHLTFMHTQERHNYSMRERHEKYWPKILLAYFLGLGFGLIPSIIFFVFYSMGASQGDREGGFLSGFFFGFLLYLLELLVTALFLTSMKRDFAGYGKVVGNGLLTAAISPFIVVPLLILLANIFQIKWLQ